MKLVVISDTHGKHYSLRDIPEGDVLIHCGDFSNVGEHEQVEDFVQWLAGHPHRFKVFIAGNHDRSLDTKFVRSSRDTEWLKSLYKRIEDLGLYYLENSGVDILGVKFWGSPITPDFYPQHWAFNCPRGKEIAKVWDQIPQDTDVLITHGPPAHILDWCANGTLVGCNDLMYHVQRVQPVYHLFGHIHESYGVEQKVDTTFVNASQLNERYSLTNKPVVLDV